MARPRPLTTPRPEDGHPVMMTLSRWKVILVVLATILGLLYTLPNVLPAKVRDT